MAHRDPRRARPASFAAAVITGLVLSLTPAATAHAADPVLTFDEPDSLSVEYGEYWGFVARSTNSTLEHGDSVSAEVGGAPSSYHPSVYAYTDTSTSVWTVVVSVAPAGELPALAAGNYTVDVEVDHASTLPPSVLTASAALEVRPAQLGIDLRVLADSNNPTAAVVSARFTGRFVDEYQSSFFPGAALSPAGEWHITLKDEEGDIAVERNFERSAGDDSLATSFYWTGAKPDTEYSATAEFVPTGASAANFDVEAATTFSYTAQADPRPVPSSTATAEPTAELPEASGFGLPLWSLILGIAVILGLAALVTVFSVRLSRRPTAPSTGAVAA